MDVKKVDDEETLKLSGAWPLFGEMVSALNVAVEDLRKAEKDRVACAKSAAREEAKNAKEEQRNKRQEDEKKAGTDVSRRSARAAQLPSEVHPFTSPTACGKPMTTFASLDGAAGKSRSRQTTRTCFRCSSSARHLCGAPTVPCNFILVYIGINMYIFAVLQQCQV